MEGKVVRPEIKRIATMMMEKVFMRSVLMFD